MPRSVDDALVSHLEENLMAQNVYLVTAGVVGGTLELVYETVVPAGGVPPRQVGVVAQALREYEEWEPCDVAATVVDPHGIVHGTWALRGEWFEKLGAGDFDEYDFSERAIDAIRSWGPRNQPTEAADERPDPGERVE